MKPELHERLAGVARAAVPGRREERVETVAEQRAQPLLAGRDIGALGGRVARRAELALASLDLVVGVRVAVLVQAGVALEQRGGERLGQLRRDHREVQRQAVLGEAADQLEQPLVVPAGVVVAEEDLDRGWRGIERM